jgi:arabinofuranosyltransferase
LTRDRVRLATAASCALAVIAYALLVYQRRWMCDDGFIVVRTVRQILAGHGPVFNAFERVEASTSTAWPWLVAGVAWLSGGDVTMLAVALGALCAIAGLAIAIDATRRFHRARGADVPLVPAGALVVLGVSPFWDYATSGLEGGLSMLWLALAWRALVGLRGSRLLAPAILFGAGPLVRPDFAIASAAFLIGAWMITRPPRRRAIALAFAALAAPLAYEIFRAGFYGVLVPSPALAKSAGGSSWRQGVLYLADFVWPYLLVVPGVLLALLLRGVRERVVILTPIVAAAVMALYIVKVGGDFMHARLLLPATFLALAPAMVAPLRRASAPILAALAAWALAAAIVRGDGRNHSIAPRVHDERAAYVAHTGDANPIDPDVFIRTDGKGWPIVYDAVAHGRHRMISEWGNDVAMNPARPGPVAFVVGRLGTGGMIAPLDAIVGDTLGLANPIGAHIPPTGAGGIGHAKQLPWVWEVADFGDPADDLRIPDGASVKAARHAMTCGALAELLDATRAPLTAGRFWDNLTGAFGRTRLEIPSDPIEAERVFCAP